MTVQPVVDTIAIVLLCRSNYFTGCLVPTENRVHAIQDLCRQGQFSRSVCSTYMFGANTYLLLRTTFFSSPFSNQVSAAEMTNFYRFSMSNQTACARKGKGY